MKKPKQKVTYQPFSTACGRSKKSLSIPAATPIELNPSCPFVSWITIINKQMKSWTCPPSPTLEWNQEPPTFPTSPLSHHSHLSTLPPSHLCHLAISLPSLFSHFITLLLTNKALQNNHSRILKQAHIPPGKRF